MRGIAAAACTAESPVAARVSRLCRGGRRSDRIGGAAARRRHAPARSAALRCARDRVLCRAGICRRIRGTNSGGSAARGPAELFLIGSRGLCSLPRAPSRRYGRARWRRNRTALPGCASASPRLCTSSFWRDGSRPSKWCFRRGTLGEGLRVPCQSLLPLDVTHFPTSGRNDAAADHLATGSPARESGGRIRPCVPLRGGDACLCRGERSTRRNDGTGARQNAGHAGRITTVRAPSEAGIDHCRAGGAGRWQLGRCLMVMFGRQNRSF